MSSEVVRCWVGYRVWLDAEETLFPSIQDACIHCGSGPGKCFGRGQERCVAARRDAFCQVSSKL